MEDSLPEPTIVPQGTVARATYAGLYRISSDGIMATRPKTAGALQAVVADSAAADAKQPGGYVGGNRTQAAAAPASHFKPAWVGATSSKPEAPAGSSSVPHLIKVPSMSSNTEGSSSSAATPNRGAGGGNSYVSLLAAATGTSPGGGNQPSTSPGADSTSRKDSSRSLAAASAKSSNSRATLASLMDDDEGTPSRDTSRSKSASASASPAAGTPKGAKGASWRPCVSTSSRTISEAWALVTGGEAGQAAHLASKAAAAAGATAAAAGAAAVPIKLVGAGVAAAAGGEPVEQQEPGLPSTTDGCSSSSTSSSSSSGSNGASSDRTDVGAAQQQEFAAQIQEGRSHKEVDGQQEALVQCNQGLGSDCQDPAAVSTSRAATPAADLECTSAAAGDEQPLISTSGAGGDSTVAAATSESGSSGQQQQQQEEEAQELARDGQCHAELEVQKAPAAENDDCSADKGSSNSSSSSSTGAHQEQPAAEAPAAPRADVVTPELEYLSPEASDPDLEGRASQTSRGQVDRAAAAAATAAVIAAAADQVRSHSPMAGAAAAAGGAASMGSSARTSYGGSAVGAESNYGELVNRLQQYLPVLKVAATSGTDFESTWGVLEAELAALTATAHMAAAQTKQLTSLDAEVVSLQQLLKSVKAAMRVSARNSSIRSPAVRTAADTGSAPVDTSSSLNGSNASSIFRRSAPMTLEMEPTAAEEGVVRMYSSLPRPWGESSDIAVPLGDPMSATIGSGSVLASQNSSSGLEARPPWTFYKRSPGSSLRRSAGNEVASPAASLSGSVSLNGSFKRVAAAAALAAAPSSAAGAMWPAAGGVTAVMAAGAPLVRVTSLAELPGPVLGAGAGHRGRSAWARRSTVSTASDLGDAGSEVSGAASNIFNFLPPLDLTQFYKVPSTSAQKAGYKVLPAAAASSNRPGTAPGSMATATTSICGTRGAGGLRSTSSSRSPVRASSPGKPASPIAGKPEESAQGQMSPRSRPASPKAADRQPGSPLRDGKAPGSPLRAPESPKKGLSLYGDAGLGVRGKAVHDPSHGAARKHAVHSAAASSKAAAAARVAAAVAAAYSVKGKPPSKKAAPAAGKQAAAAAQPVAAAAAAAAAATEAVDRPASNGGKATIWNHDPAFKAAIQAFTQASRCWSKAQLMAVVAGRPRNEEKQLADTVGTLNRELAAHGIPWSLSKLGPFAYAVYGRKLQLVIRAGQVLVRSTAGYEEWTVALGRLPKDPPPAAAAASDDAGGAADCEGQQGPPVHEGQDAAADAGSGAAESTASSNHQGLEQQQQQEQEQEQEAAEAGHEAHQTPAEAVEQGKKATAAVVDAAAVDAAEPSHAGEIGSTDDQPDTAEAAAEAAAAAAAAAVAEQAQEDPSAAAAGAASTRAGSAHKHLSVLLPSSRLGSPSPPASAGPAAAASRQAVAAHGGGRGRVAAVSTQAAAGVQRTASLLVLSDHYEPAADLATASQPHKQGPGQPTVHHKQHPSSSGGGGRVSHGLTSQPSATWLGDPGAGDWKRLNRTSSAVVNHSMHSGLRGAAGASGADSPRLHRLQKVLSVAAAASYSAGLNSPSAALAGKGPKGGRLNALVTQAAEAAASGPGLLEGSGGSADISALL